MQSIPTAANKENKSSFDVLILLINAFNRLPSGKRPAKNGGKLSPVMIILDEFLGIQYEKHGGLIL